jgi:hypothetical protein
MIHGVSAYGRGKLAQRRALLMAVDPTVIFFFRLKRASLTRQNGYTIKFVFDLVSDTRRCPTQPEITMT